MGLLICVAVTCFAMSPPTKTASRYTQRFCTQSQRSRISFVFDKSVTHFWICFLKGALYLWYIYVIGNQWPLRKINSTCSMFTCWTEATQESWDCPQPDRQSRLLCPHVTTIPPWNETNLILDLPLSYLSMTPLKKVRNTEKFCTSFPVSFCGWLILPVLKCEEFKLLGAPFHNYPL